MAVDYLAAAKKLIEYDLSPIPIKNDGTKQPYASALPLKGDDPEYTGPDGDQATWTPFQTRKATDAELSRFFKNGAIVGITCGVASGNLEVLDFDVPGKHKPGFKPVEAPPMWEPWLSRVRERLGEDFVSRLLVFRTPSGGRQIYYRIPEQPTGNKTLARFKDGETGIETRGHGGYVAAYPSPGYVKQQGKLSAIPVFTMEEREDLFDAAFELHEATPQVHCVPKGNPSFERPSDKYAKAHTWQELLGRAGWTLESQSGANSYWRRPGKTRGKSASTNGEDGTFYVFTSNAYPLEPGHAYTKFMFVAMLEHGGDFYHMLESVKKEQQPIGMTPVVSKLEEPMRKWVNMGDVEAQEIEWLYRPFLPIGVVTLAYGDSGIGKSTALLAMAASMSRGIAPPHGKPADPINVIVLSAEDPASTVIKPRLMRLEADPRRFLVPEEHTPEGLSNPLRLDEDGIEELTEQVEAFKAKLVIVDPLRAYFMAAADMNSQTDARSFMRMLTGVATNCGCSVVLVHHVNKGVGNNVRYRASGSQDFIDACRSALFFHQDPDDETNCAITHVKHNYSAKGPTLGYTIKVGADDPEDWQFGWTGDSDLTPEDCTQLPKEKVSPRKLEAAKKWLCELLSRNGSMAATMVFEAAKMDGIAVVTLKRAKSEAGVLSIKNSGDGGWEWALPQGVTPWWSDKEDPYA